MRHLAVPAVLGWAALAPLGAAAADAITLVLSESGGAYEEVAETLRHELRGVAEIVHRLASEAGAPAAVPPKAVIAVGAQACRQLARAPVAAAHRLCTLVPRAAVASVVTGARSTGPPLYAVLLDQPLGRQMRLVRLAMPQRHRIAVIRGPQANDAEELQAAALAAGVRLQTGRVESAEQLAGVLHTALHGAQVLLALPDADVYNRGTIQNILRTTFRERIPVVAFSPAYVRAGATLAVYSTPAQIGRQTARTVRALLAGREVPTEQHPQEFEIAVNALVARALDIDIEDADALAGQLRRLEGRR